MNTLWELNGDIYCVRGGKIYTWLFFRNWVESSCFKEEADLIKHFAQRYLSTTVDEHFNKWYEQQNSNQS